MVSSETPVLVPGTPKDSVFPLARYRHPDLMGAVRAFTKSTTRKGDLLLAIGAITGAAIREVVDEHRRIVALSRNPVDLLCAALDLEASSDLGARIQIALTQLGDLPKGDRPLVLHIQSQYASRCPHCHQQGTAEWFAWDRESGQPFAKRVVCPKCDQAHEGPVDSLDLERAGLYPSRSGPAYHLALSRATGQATDTLARIPQLIELYTPRNLAALMTLVQRLPQLHSDPQVVRGVHALLLEAFDAGSALTPYEAPQTRPRSLRVPPKFLERNVWMILERAAADYQAHYGQQGSSDVTPQHAAETLSALLRQTEPGYLLSGHSVQHLHATIGAETFSAIVLHLIPPDAVFWALAILWSRWLWGEGVPSDLSVFLQRRRLDWEWYQHSLAVALRHAQPHLTPTAPILVLSPSSDPDAIRALCYAARRNNLTIDRWIACPPDGYRVQMQVPPQKPSAVADLDETAPIPATDVAVQILEARGEPLKLQQLHAFIMLHTQTPTAMDLDLSAASPLIVLAEDHVWLRTPQKAAQPLADRLEEALLRLLATDFYWTYDELLGEIYQAFYNTRSPEPALIEALIQAYTTQDAEGRLMRRLEDEPRRRRHERQQLSKDLDSLGTRLAYRSARRPGGDVVWREHGTCAYLFRITTSAMLADPLLKPPPRCDGRRCLVVPGGRAALIAHKLRRDPRLAAAAEAQRWTFIKFRHCRRMIAEMTDRSEIEVFLGLDPIVEQQSAQIPLPLQIKRPDE